MSNKIARQRAEAGMIFRDGHLVNKHEWFAAHPTPEMKRRQQDAVDKAVEEMKRESRLQKQGVLLVRDGKILDFKDTSAVLAEAALATATKSLTPAQEKCRAMNRSLFG